MKKLLIRVFLTIVLSIGLMTSSISIANAETVSTVPTVPDYPCEPEDVDNLYQNPEDPNSFYQCAPYGLVLMKCPSGLAFDVDLNICNWPKGSEQDSQ
ncbi:carbohydrate-binding module family 14 protein (plasmid) [Nostoc sp. UHCC 0302]|uniref:carbohydrate-binding module family 14 protein n=1 Tax=Nostoc sp. UHCC 0302 TaxID=3134896 RepID=UPI00311C9D04